MSLFAMNINVPPTPMHAIHPKTTLRVPFMTHEDGLAEFFGIDCTFNTYFSEERTNQAVDQIS